MRKALQQINSIHSNAGKAVYTLVTAVLICAFIGALCMNYNEARFMGTHYNSKSHHYSNCEQYADLADALIHGSLSLDLPVAPELMQLENPYAVGARVDIASKDVVIYWDHAYYEGRYYSYFGVVPAVLLYAPYEIVTGDRLKTPIAIAVLGILAILALALMLRRLATKYFGDTCTTAMLAALLILAFCGANFTYLAFASMFYSVPILAAILFASLGLWLWVGACPPQDEPKNESQNNPGEEKLSWPHVFVGSLCMALTLGSRPQFALAALLAFPIFGQFLFSRKWLFSPYGAKTLAVALVPFAAVYAALFAYNFARFGSPLDFGAAYNLTGFDMTTYHQRKALTLAASARFLFQPINFTAEFPFVGTTDTTFPGLGWLPTEPFFGGFFMLNPLMYAIALLPLAWKQLKARRLLGFTVISLLAAIAMVVIDIRIAGISQRYFADSGFFFALAACAVFLALHSRRPKNKALTVAGGIIIALGLAFTLQIDLMTLLSPSRYYSVAQINPEFFEMVRSFIMGQ